MLTTKLYEFHINQIFYHNFGRVCGLNNSLKANYGKFLVLKRCNTSKAGFQWEDKSFLVDIFDESALPYILIILNLQKMTDLLSNFLAYTLK